jgi:hypothetical protein
MRTFPFIALIIFIFFLVSCQHSRQTEKVNGGISKLYIGTIYVSGNEPFTRLQLTTSTNVSYQIKADSATYHQLWQLQGQQVIVQGEVRQTPLGNVISVQKYHTGQ